jgi:hypothetical protein
LYGKDGDVFPLFNTTEKSYTKDEDNKEDKKY